MAELPLTGYRIVDLSTEIAGAYAMRLLADGGADVVKVEDPAGDPLRRWSASGHELGDEDGALFRFLHGGHRSVTAAADDAADLAFVQALVADADAVVWGPGSTLAAHPELAPEALLALAPHASVLCVTPYGLTGPWAGRPTSDLIVQASCGGLGQRGEPGRPPMPIGGRYTEWASGMEAAFLLLASRWRAVRTGVGEIVDVSALESATLTTVMHPMTWLDIAGYPLRPMRMLNLPDIHPTKDGFVGFMVVTGQQWLDFCAMVERIDWLDDASLGIMRNRVARREELTEAIDSWTSQRTSAEVVELADLLRVPVADVASGATVTGYDHFIEQDTFLRNPHGFLQPRPPWRFHGHDDLVPAPRPAPTLGQHTAELRGASRRGATRPAPAPAPHPAPFAGLRVADFTANWAGPVVGHTLALLGADVIHVESAKRPDPIRFNTSKEMGSDQWWEFSGLFQGPNTNKRDLTLDLSTPRGIALAKRLIASCDVVCENFSPRVMEQLGLGPEAVHEANPRAIYVRMPAFGLSGPWRDRGGYAQTIEMSAGLAWRTGEPERRPVIPNGPCDPVAGGHATVALLLALEHRRRTGEGMFVECPMIGGALNIAAEQVVEHSAYGARLDRMGTRAEHVAPQGVYLSADPDGSALPGPDRWVAISATTDEQWRALQRALGSPAWAAAPGLATLTGRLAAHDTIDAELATWVGARPSGEAVAALLAAGVPSAVVVLPHETGEVEQLVARRVFTRLEHPVTGPVRYIGLAGKLSNGPQHDITSPAPTLGQHNHEILVGELGLSEDEYAALERDAIIGTTTGTAAAW